MRPYLINISSTISDKHHDIKILEDCKGDVDLQKCETDLLKLNEIKHKNVITSILDKCHTTSVEVTPLIPLSCRTQSLYDRPVYIWQSNKIF